MNWTDGPGVVSASVAVLALIGTFIGFVLTRRERSRADLAAKRAEAAEQRANDARDRAADALEQIAAAHQPEPYVRWADAEYLNDHRWSVRNIGNAPALNTWTERADQGPGSFRPDSDTPRTIESGTSIGFSVWNVLGGGPRPRIRWTDPDGTPRQHDVIR